MKGCYSKGGKIRPKIIHGLRTGQHNNPNVLRAARANGGAVQHVDGERSRPRMDRPMRQDGGRTTISEDSKREAARLREEGDSGRRAMTTGLAKDAGSFLLGDIIRDTATRRPGRILGRALQGAAAMSALSRPAQKFASRDADQEADRIERGMVKEGEEDRKDGGRVERKNGGPLTAKKRDALPAKDFAGPDRSYPVNDENHARAALSMVAAHGSPAVKAKVRAKVARKFPGIKQSKG